MSNEEDKEQLESQISQEKLKKDLGVEQVVHMKVAAQIVQHLSKGIYSNPANCIKELINNAFDADSSKVIIRAKPEFDTFSITDYGEGMNYLDFDSKFLFISRSDKRDASLYTKSGRRPLIGKIGIGFVAASEICNKMTVISTKEGEDFKFQAEIDFSKFKEIMSQKREFYEISEVKLVNLPEDKEVHYTIILLEELSQDFKELLQDKDIIEAGIKVRSFDGQSFENIINQVVGQQLNLWKDIAEYWRLVLGIANIIPVGYLEEGPIIVKNDKNKEIFKEQIQDIKEIKETLDKFDFNVDFDGVLLKKPILLPTEKDIALDEGKYDIYTFKEEFSDFGDESKLKFRGYIYGQNRQILPPQMRGLIVRVKNTSIGDIDPDFWGYPYPEKLFIPWVFAEVYVEDGLEDAMNVNRNSFIITHPHYRRLRSYIHNKLHKDVFTKFRSRYIERREIAKLISEIQRQTKMGEYLRTAFNRDIRIVVSEEPTEFPVSLNTTKNEMTINPKHPILRRLKKKGKLTTEDILVIFEASCQRSEGDIEKLRQLFFDSLKNWYNEHST